MFHFIVKFILAIVLIILVLFYWMFFIFCVLLCVLLQQLLDLFNKLNQIWVLLKKVRKGPFTYLRHVDHNTPIEYSYVWYIDHKFIILLWVTWLDNIPAPSLVFCICIYKLKIYVLKFVFFLIIAIIFLTVCVTIVV